MNKLFYDVPFITTILLWILWGITSVTYIIYTNHKINSEIQKNQKLRKANHYE